MRMNARISEKFLKKYDGYLSIQTDNHRFKIKMFLQC